MNPMQLIAENKIREAMENGEFDNLSCQGQYVDLYEDEHISPEFRMAYKIMKNAGYEQTEGEIIKQIRALKDEAAGLGSGPRAQAMLKLIRRKEAELQAKRNRFQRATKPEKFEG
jgi:hypothetical protein